MNTNTTRRIGFRRTETWQTDTGHTGFVGWRFWVGPFLVARTSHARFEWWSARRAGWDSPRAYSLTVFGVSVGWAGR